MLWFKLYLQNVCSKIVALGIIFDEFGVLILLNINQYDINEYSTLLNLFECGGNLIQLRVGKS